MVMFLKIEKPHVNTCFVGGEVKSEGSEARVIGQC